MNIARHGTTDPSPNDAWAMEGNGYSRDKFYTKSTDGRGNSELIQLKVTPFVFGIIAELVESQEFPDYRTKADVLRDALVHLLHYRREMMKDATRMVVLQERVDRMMAEAKTERLRADLEQERRYTDALVEAMGVCVQSGNVSRAAEAIEDAEKALETLPFNLAKRVREEIRGRTRELVGMKAIAAAIEVEGVEG